MTKPNHDRLLAELEARYTALSRENQMKAAVLDSLPHLVAMIDSQLRYRFANSAWERWHGLSAEKVCTMTVPEILGPAGFAQVEPAMRRALAGERAQFEAVIRTLRGGERAVSCTYIPNVHAADGTPGFLAVVADLSDRHAMERRLKESETQLALIFNSAPVGIVQLDEERRYLSANATYLQFLGYSLEELRTMTMYDVTHPEDLATTKWLSESFGEDLNFRLRRLEKRYLGKGGRVVWGLVSSQQVVNPLTGRKNLFTVIEDITEAKTRELELQRSATELSHLFALSSDVMCVTGIDGVIRRANNAFHGTLGLGPDEAHGRQLLDFIHPDDVPATRLALSTSTRGAHQRFEARCLVKTGGTRVVGWTVTHDFENGLIYATGRDLTEKKQNEIKLAYSSKMASLGEMAGGIAHEVNNPLAIILGKVTNMQHLLRQSPTDVELLREELESLERTGHRIAKIIRGLRAFSRNSEADPMGVVNVRRVVDETLDLCAERMRNRNIEISVDCARDISALGRASQLSQVLMNLLGNSHDAVESLPQPWIHIRAERQGPSVLISVEDSGPGIEPRLRDKIMQPFFTTKEVGRGTGLGLSISKGIVEEHGGQLRYDDTSAHTRFVVEIPAQ